MEKISQTPRGLVAGVGSINLFQPVIDELRASGFQDEAEITKILRTSRTHVLTLPGGNAHLAKDRTGLFASFVETRVRLSLFQVDDDFNPTRIQTSLQTLLPDGALPGQNTVQQEALCNGLVAAVKRDQIEKVVEHFQKYFGHFRKLHPQVVGPFFQIGIHSDAEVTITDLIPAQ
ncbi:MAG: hypothetical protein M3541_12525 [Acidobacteriota bacterium]|nr:hypothetical protein [Acidobacteriota bacterium]